jgi:hypothetical protein
VVDSLDVHHKVEEDPGSSDQGDRPDQQVVEAEAVERYPSPHADRSWDSRCDSAAGVAGAAAPGGEEAVAAVPAPAEV